MLDLLRSHFGENQIHLDIHFHRDLKWFQKFYHNLMARHFSYIALYSLPLNLMPVCKASVHYESSLFNAYPILLSKSFNSTFRDVEYLGGSSSIVSELDKQTDFNKM